MFIFNFPNTGGQGERARCGHEGRQAARPSYFAVVVAEACQQGRRAHPPHEPGGPTVALVAIHEHRGGRRRGQSPIGIRVRAPI